ncbi:MAG: DUF1850 domain-containing protein [Deltaproteobacteria bacterium]|nr:DUF1850 domain-containing protein [Deltaproteobacteria bacterium]
MKAKKFIIASILFIALCGVWFYPVYVLGLQNTEDGKWLFFEGVHPGDIFSTRYTHSVKHRPVWDIYFIDKYYRMMLEETIFPGYGYGLPYLTKENEKFTEKDDGNYSISNIKRHIPSLLICVGRPYDNTFTFKEQSPINLSALIGDGLVDMRVHKLNVLTYFYEEIMLWK